MHPAGRLAGARTSKTASHTCTPHELRWLERLGGDWSSLSPCTVSHPEEPLFPHGLSHQQESWNLSQGSWLPRGWNGSCKVSRLRPRGHTVSLLLHSIDQSKSQGQLRTKRRRYRSQLLIKGTCAYNNGRNCWQPSLQIFHVPTKF